MPIEVIIPSLGESITSGLLATWRVADGDAVSAGDILYDLETDKITSEGIAEVAGVIHLKVEEGEEVEIGQLVAVIDETASVPVKEVTVETVPTAESTEKKDFPPSPAVRRIASETGIDPSSIQGSGKDGRVTKGDMLSASASKPAVKPAVETVTPVVEDCPKKSDRVTRKKMTPLRKKIAQRLVEAQQNAAILTTFNEVDMSAVMELRKKHQDKFIERHGVKLGFMSFFVKAVVQALKTVPAINAQIEGDEIIENNFYDIGVAVSTPRGLMVPVIRDADDKNFAQIEGDIIGYGKKAKEGKIGIDDLQGGVFTITNGGIFGSMLSTPILNTPQSGILGMHTIQQRVVAVDGQIEIRPMMYLALSYDHRLVDGKEAVTFLVKVKEAIEDPSRLLFEL